jgi:hypothetical protein
VYSVANQADFEVDKKFHMINFLKNITNESSILLITTHGKLRTVDKIVVLTQFQLACAKFT